MRAVHAERVAAGVVTFFCFALAPVAWFFGLTGAFGLGWLGWLGWIYPPLVVVVSILAGAR